MFPQIVTNFCCCSYTFWLTNFVPWAKIEVILITIFFFLLYVKKVVVIYVFQRKARYFTCNIHYNYILIL